MLEPVASVDVGLTNWRHELWFRVWSGWMLRGSARRKRVRVGAMGNSAGMLNAHMHVKSMLKPAYVASKSRRWYMKPQCKGH